MEKQPHQEYRDELAEELKEVRSREGSGREDAKFILDAVQGTKEDKDAEILHHKDTQTFVEEKAMEERQKLPEVRKMKEIVETLPLDYIPIPVSVDSKINLHAVLLKIQGTEDAFLVSDDLKRRGTEFGIIVGTEKIFIICGCESRSCGKLSKDFEQSLAEIATREKITRIISRHLKDDSDLGADIKFIDAEDLYFKGGDILTETRSILKENGLIPTRQESESEIEYYKKLQKEWEMEKQELEQKAELEKFDPSI